jgi:hypothetical protein
MDLRDIEKSLAYEHAASAIESFCSRAPDDGHTWFDLATSDVDLSDEATYLESRGLLDRHRMHRAWVSVRHEDEPMHGEKFSAEGSEPSQLDRIEAATKSILEEIHTMAETQADIDVEIGVVAASLTALQSALTSAIADLEAKAAGSAVDFTPEFTQLQTIANTLNTLTSSTITADPGAPAAAAVTTPAASTPAAS